MDPVDGPWQSIAARFPLSSLILSRRTKIQTIDVERNDHGEVTLHLNRRFQFSTATMDAYHEALGVVPALCVPDAGRVLILGGGDGLLARAFLAHVQDATPFTCEIDAEMVAIFRDHPLCRALNDGAFSDPLQSVVVADATEWIKDQPAGFFRVICGDYCTEATEWSATRRCYANAHLEDVKRVLAPGGVVAYMVSSSQKLFAHALGWFVDHFAHVKYYPCAWHLGAGEKFVLASDAPLLQRRPVPPACRFLTQARMNAILGAPDTNSEFPSRLLALAE